MRVWPTSGTFLPHLARYIYAYVCIYIYYVLYQVRAAVLVADAYLMDGDEYGETNPGTQDGPEGKSRGEGGGYDWLLISGDDTYVFLAAPSSLNPAAHSSP